MTDPEKKVGDHKNLTETEGLMIRYLSLLDSQRFHQKKAEDLSKKIRELRKNHPEIRSIMGEVSKHDKINEDPEAYQARIARTKEKKDRKKRKIEGGPSDARDEPMLEAGAPTSGVPVGGKGKGGRTQLLSRIAQEVPPVDKSLQKKAEK